MSLPIKGNAYAVGTGIYVGEMFIYIKESKDDYHFISIPKNINRSVPKDKFLLGLQSKIVDNVGPIDVNVFSLLEKQFDYNLKLDK
jgi:hypothetical protein